MHILCKCVFYVCVCPQSLFSITHHCLKNPIPELCEMFVGIFWCIFMSKSEYWSSVEMRWAQSAPKHALCNTTKGQWELLLLVSNHFTKMTVVFLLVESFLSLCCRSVNNVSKRTKLCCSHLPTECTTKICERNYFHARFGIYQIGRERRIQSNLPSGLRSCSQVSQWAFTVYSADFKKN